MDGMTAAGAIPPVEPLNSVSVPSHDRARLANGLCVLAAARPGPLVELRLCVPLTGAPAVAAVLAETLLSGRERFPHRLDAIGGHLYAAAGADSLVIGGHALATHTRELLDLLAEVLRTPHCPEPVANAARNRIADALRVAGSEPALAVQEALTTVRYAGHPYGESAPSPERVRQVSTDEVLDLHASRLRPDSATLIVVAPEPVTDTFEAASDALASWLGGPEPVPSAPPVPPPRPRSLTLVHRRSAVQSSIRLGLDVVGLGHPDFPAVELAHLSLGSMYSCRLVETLRERHGCAYTPRSVLVHQRQASQLVVSADVSPQSTATALDLIRQELRRLATDPVRGAELERVRGCALGRHTLTMGSSAQLADLMLLLADQGVELDWVERHLRHLNTVTESDVESVARRYLDPELATEIVLGDTATLHAQLPESQTMVHRSTDR